MVRLYTILVSSAFIRLDFLSLSVFKGCVGWFSDQDFFGQFGFSSDPDAFFGLGLVFLRIRMLSFFGLGLVFLRIRVSRFFSGFGLIQGLGLV
jgi:hypothetical protein